MYWDQFGPKYEFSSFQFIFESVNLHFINVEKKVRITKSATRACYSYLLPTWFLVCAKDQYMEMLRVESFVILNSGRDALALYLQHNIGIGCVMAE